MQYRSCWLPHHRAKRVSGWIVRLRSIAAGLLALDEGTVHRADDVAEKVRLVTGPALNVPVYSALRDGPDAHARLTFRAKLKEVVQPAFVAGKNVGREEMGRDAPPLLFKSL